MTTREMPEAGQAGTEGADEHGKAQVRRLLIAPVEAAGLKRGQGVTLDAHAARVERIVAALAYMAPANLATLAQLVQYNATGGYKDCWPPEVAIVNWGRGLQAPPLREDRVVTSWLASVEGPRARAAGQLVELYRFLRARRLPPGPYDRRQIEAEAQDNARRLLVYRERMDRDTAHSDERAWVVAYLRDRDQAEHIVRMGETKREGAAA